MTRSPRGAFAFGGLWVLLAGTQLLTGADDRGVFQVFTVILGLMGVAVIVSGVAQLRRSRR